MPPPPRVSTFDEHEMFYLLIPVLSLLTLNIINYWSVEDIQSPQSLMSFSLTSLGDSETVCRLS